MMALQLLFTAVVERPLRPRAPSAASVRAATPAERSSARSDFLFLFRGTHGDFRLSEVRSVAETLGVGPVSFRSAGAAGTLSLACCISCSKAATTRLKAPSASDSLHLSGCSSRAAALYALRSVSSVAFGGTPKTRCGMGAYARSIASR